jgi:hypothetical protein
VLDTGLDRFSALATSESPAALAQLQQAGISHVLLGHDELAWSARFDPEQRLARWLESFERTAPQYLTLEFSSKYTRVYRVTGTTPGGDQP